MLKAMLAAAAVAVASWPAAPDARVSGGDGECNVDGISTPVCESRPMRTCNGSNKYVQCGNVVAGDCGTKNCTTGAGTACSNTNCQLPAGASNDKKGPFPCRLGEGCTQPPG